jgi:hypothetical protein
MSTTLFAVVIGLGTATVVLLALYLYSLKSLRRFKTILDVEGYKAECERKADAELAECTRLQGESKSLEAQIIEHKKRVRQYQVLLGNLRTAAELQERIKSDQATIQRIEAVIGEAKSLSELAAKTKYHENYLEQLKADIEAVEEVGELHEFGFYAPQFKFESAEEYKQNLAKIRAKQKAMLNGKTACTCDAEWTVGGDKRKGQKMVNQHIKLMLRAFNGECDAAVGKVKYNNVVALENRIKKSFEAINKLGEVKQVNLAQDYRDLKLDELHLAHEYQEKKQEEREEQQRIREAMREELKVAKEIEDATAEAERDEEVRKAALERAREELAHESGEQTAKLAALVSKLENELQEAIDRKAKAIARAQLTRSGHVYILSNVGAFGEDIYKIGLTRRLDPLERVNELGGAAVPFPFDVHAIIYSEDAPALENKLHRHFASRRVNLVNLRREFFQVSLDEIRAAVAENFGHISFVTVAEAAQYRKTLVLRKEGQQEAKPLQIA